MSGLRRLTAAVGLALALGAARPGVVTAEDAASTPTPAPDRTAALARADALNAQAGALFRRGKHADATPLAREVLAIRERVLGADHVDVAQSLGNLARLLQAQAAYDEARPLFERALAIQEKALGPDHPDVATTLNHLAELLRTLAAYPQARPLYERALAIRERSLGADHPDVATSLNNLGMLHRALGACGEARSCYERALAIQERALGKEHLNVAATLHNLAEALRALGSYEEAQRLCERALAIRERALGKDHADVAQSHNNLAVLLEASGAYGAARVHLERALAIRERAHGKTHPNVAVTLGNLAVVLRAQGAYAEARRLAERALEIDEKALGPDHPSVARSLNNLAAILQAQGAYAAARPIYERTLAIQERTLGKAHPSTLTTLGNLAELLRVQGAYEEARVLCERVLAIRERTLGEDHADVARSLNNLAEVLRAQGAFEDARPLLERALAIYEHVFGRDHPRVAQALSNLALVLHALHADGEARPLVERAVAIQERALGHDHPSVANALVNLAVILGAHGASGQTRSLVERALAIWEGTLGADHPWVARGLIALAQVLEAEGADDDARPRYERALALTEAHARAQLSTLSAGQRLGFLRSTRSRLDHWLGFAPRLGRSGHPEVLRFRGLVARAEAAERAMSRAATGDDRRLLDALQAAQRLASRLANDVPVTRDPEVRAAWQRRYAEAAAERDRLTRELAARVAPARTALERLDLGLADVQEVLGPDTALVDVLRVRDRYLAWIVRATGEPVRLDVGAADAIDAASAEFVSAVAEDAGDDASAAAIHTTGDALKGLVWTPVAAKLGADVKRVVLCPDAALAAVPFAALPGKTPDTALLDDLSISYVFHPFDLVPHQDAPPSGVGVLVVGGVDYESADGGSTESPLPERPAVLASLDRAPRGGSFGPIPATRVEAEAVRDRLGSASTTLLLGADATEARFREAVRRKRIVHVATHGFARTDLLAGLYDRKVKDALLSADAERMLAIGHDPMLLSGLALAGANPRDGAGGDDGILTALEASYLDLDGVDLVTLSACETAKGTAESGEGVLGLVSAFQMAGARRVLASLWKVDDEATRRLMDGVYERVLRTEAPLSPADALREAALALRTWKDPAGKARFAAPRYWAAFVAYGG